MLDTVYLASQVGRSLVVGDVVRSLAAAQAHAKAAFTIANTAAPTISGSAVQAQTLTVDEGGWTGAPSTFSYAWARCDASGNGCTAIAGATGQTYVVSADDSGQTLRVTVTGSNSVSSLDSPSAGTAVVQ